jgi:hypothetical protein
LAIELLSWGEFLGARIPERVGGLYDRQCT